MGNTTGRPERDFDYRASFGGQGEYKDPLINMSGVSRFVPGHVTDILTDFTVGLLQERSWESFALILSHKAVHAPFTAQEGYRGLFDGVRVLSPAKFGADLGRKPAFLSRRVISKDSGQVRHFMRRYLQTPARVDERVGWVVAARESRVRLAVPEVG
jgi:hypothetical protein